MIHTDSYRYGVVWPVCRFQNILMMKVANKYDVHLLSKLIKGGGVTSYGFVPIFLQLHNIVII